MKRLFKKGGEGVPWWLALMILATIFLVIWLVIFGKGTGSFSEQTTAKTMELKLEACKTKGDKGQLDGTPYPDKDVDGLPDYCDNCPDTPNFDWDMVKDEDGDNFPVPKEEKLQKPPSQGGKLCCAVGIEESKLEGDGKEKYCETEDNDKKYGPNKLVTSYLYPR